ncbi:hypothetical protein C3B44_03155 [Corynebacterium yudongzhengii]|uniref:hypothetical protein n=1 Tax=Corynebacterium yudongzhengii TaxID=2080740 RepID=UPI000D39252B|nr:hypothetical protein [Corynebacterium yudongzhengii]AWB81475.1 hypothetical protein C3B44_03155 [Corynebacterium yudongzhengii]
MKKANDRDEGKWTWDGPELLDRQGVTLAYVTADVLTIGQTRLLLEHTIGSMRFRMRATGPDGTFGTIAQSGFTLARLNAQCEDRCYRLERVGPLRRERRIVLADGSVAVTLRPSGPGVLEVYDGPASDGLPLLDSVFLTYGCAQVDAPRRNLRV